MILCSMNQAMYQPNNVGHFGLALEKYAHFTSPIRRYPDLLVHRALKWLIEHGSFKGYGYSMQEMSRLGEQTSRCERRADEAVWDVEEQLKCAFMLERIGEEFDAQISSIMPFGAFVRIPEYGIDGLVHVSALPRDYYHKGGLRSRARRGAFGPALFIDGSDPRAPGRRQSRGAQDRLRAGHRAAAEQ